MSPRLTRLLAAGLVAGLVALGVFQVRNQQDARTDAEKAAAAFAYSQQVTARHDALLSPSQRAAQDLAALQQVLVEHLAQTDRAFEAIADDRARLARRLVAAADDLAEATTADDPEVPSHLIGSRAAGLSEDVGRLRERAGTLADDLRAVAATSERWSEAVRTLDARAREYVAAVEAHAPTDDPDELTAIWEAERAPLEAYRNAAGLARDVAGLEAYAAAHLTYAEDNVAWIDEAVGLLADGQLDAYNQRFEELFAAADPFGFGAASTAAAEDALTSGVIADLDRARGQVSAYLDALTELRRRTPAVLAPAPSPSA